MFSDTMVFVLILELFSVAESVSEVELYYEGGAGSVLNPAFLSLFERGFIMVFLLGFFFFFSGSELFSCFSFSFCVSSLNFLSIFLAFLAHVFVSFIVIAIARAVPWSSMFCMILFCELEPLPHTVHGKVNITSVSLSSSDCFSFERFFLFDFCPLIYFLASGLFSSLEFSLDFFLSFS